AASALNDLGSVEHGVTNQAWPPHVLEKHLLPYYEQYPELLITADARSPSRLMMGPWTGVTSDVRQVLTDPEEHLEWSALFQLHLDASRAAGRPVLTLARLAAAE